jgi:hypothetical protein
MTDRAEDALETLRKPLPVPTTAIFSRSDGLLDWRSCMVDGPNSENVAVHSSHVGLVSNPLVLAVLTDRLAHIDSAPHVPFSWWICVQRIVFETLSPPRHRLNRCGTRLRPSIPGLPNPRWRTAPSKVLYVLVCVTGSRYQRIVTSVIGRLTPQTH